MLTPRTLVELYQQSCQDNAERPAFGTRRRQGWEWLSYGELLQRVDAARVGLASLGVGPGDKVAIIARNRVEWPIACYAAAGLGAVVVPMYEKQLPSEWRFILGDAGAKVALVSGALAFAAVTAMQAELLELDHVVGFDQPEEDPRSWAALERHGAAAALPAILPAPDAVAQIIYTSGTTGLPKGVLLTHGNFVADIEAMRKVFPIEPDERTVSFLPWAHVLGQIGELHHGVSVGISMALNDELTRLLEDIQVVRPTLLVAVPSVFNRIHASVVRQIAHKSKLVQRLFADGLATATHQHHGDHVGLLERLELAVDDRLILAKVRDKLGGRLKWVFCGGASLGREVAEFIDSLGITVHEGYGLTETSCTATLQPKGARKIGTAGQPLPGVMVDIDTLVTGDPRIGEVVIYGPIVMKGYHNRPRENAAAFTPDGGLRTGDLGYFDDDGYLVITGRIKEQFKLDNGKYVMPMPIEEAIKLSPYIKNVLLHGANRPYCVALLVPDVTAITEWAAATGITLGDPTRDAALHQLLEREVQQRCQDFPAFQRPKAVAIVGEDFSTDNGLLTPTLKLKRQRVVERYVDRLEQLYQPSAAEHGAAVAP